MTAEIAIINRGAVTLAADSVMTVSVGGRRKVYTSADKIFEISENDPIGLMIYNNLEFMGSPLDVLIKQFRSKLGEKRFASVDECAESFFSYIWQEWDHSDQLQVFHAYQMLTPVYSKIWQDTNYKFGKELERTGKNPNLLLVLISSIEQAISEYEMCPISESLADVTEEMLSAQYDEMIDDVIRRSFKNPPINEEQLKLFRRVGILPNF